MRLILFCDYGLDDAAATVDALSHATADGYEEVVLVAIGGNVPSEVALRNAKKLVAGCGFALPRVTIVDTTAIVQPNEYLKEIHGQDGMGDLFEEREPLNVPVVPFASWLSDFSGKYRLLSLGPMTLVPQLLERADCDLLVFMGGNIAETPNFHGYEFNHALDRAAFASVVKRFRHIAVTMDTCRDPLLNVQDRALEGGGLMRAIVNRAREMTFVSGEKGSYIWDDMAVKYLRHPEWFELYQAEDRDGNVLTVAKYIYGRAYAEIVEL